MSSVHSQCLDLLRFLSATEINKISAAFDNTDAWYYKSGDQPILKLFEQFFEYMDYLLASDEFYNAFQGNSILNELYSLMELVYESGDKFNMGENKFYQRESIEVSPVWKLIRRLAQEALVVIHEENSEMTVSFEDVICI